MVRSVFTYHHGRVSIKTESVLLHFSTVAPGKVQTGHEKEGKLMFLSLITDPPDNRQEFLFKLDHLDEDHKLLSNVFLTVCFALLLLLRFFLSNQCFKIKWTIYWKRPFTRFNSDLTLDTYLSLLCLYVFRREGRDWIISLWECDQCWGVAWVILFKRC